MHYHVIIFMLPMSIASLRYHSPSAHRRCFHAAKIIAKMAPFVSFPEDRLPAGVLPQHHFTASVLPPSSTFLAMPRYHFSLQASLRVMLAAGARKECGAAFRCLI